ncbi:MAG: helix-turn-helix transcriptional regulator [Clostridia bacterium]|nr:helix-turn-helix transcriptional regulator [Clostridia bacterium]
MNSLKQIVAANITRFRKQKNLTQLEFANKLNYSDKAISKWERADSIPDIIILKQISDLFGVTVDYLLTEHSQNENLLIVEYEKKSKINKISLTLLSSSPIWLVSTIVFTLVAIFLNKYIWYVFFISVPLTILIFLIFNSIWGNRRNNYLIISSFVWSILLCIYLSFIKLNIWQLFILGIPAQFIIVLWSTLKNNHL